MKQNKCALPGNTQIYTSGCEFYFACNLKRLRLSLVPRMSQARLAKKLGVTRNTYAGYESGKRLPPAWFVCCTADFFKVAVDELIGQELEKEKVNFKLRKGDNAGTDV